MGVLEEPYGTFHSAESGNVASADQAHVPSAENIVVQMSDANTGTCTVDIEQQLPGMTTWASRSQTALAQNGNVIVVVAAPVGLIRVSLSSNNGSITVKYGAHYPR